MPTPDEYRVHDAVWTPQTIGRFWDHYNAASAERYFTEVVGDSLLRLVQRELGMLTDPILDFGCGSGHLLGKLLHRGHRCMAVDYSAGSVAAVREKYGQDPRLLVAEKVDAFPIHLESESCGTAFLVETIEHLLADSLQPTLRELYRVVARGGHVVVTTPHDEDLRRAQVTCPDCGCRFHRIQHVSSWTAATLRDVMAEAGFECRYCQATLLAKRGWRGTISRFARLYLLRQTRPHLVYIGRKV